MSIPSRLAAGVSPWHSGNKCSTSITVELEPSTNSSTAPLSRSGEVSAGEIGSISSPWGSLVAEYVRSSCRINQVFLHHFSCLSKPRLLLWVLQYRHFRRRCSTLDFLEYFERRGIVKQTRSLAGVKLSREQNNRKLKTDVKREAREEQNNENWNQRHQSRRLPAMVP